MNKKGIPFVWINLKTAFWLCFCTLLAVGVMYLFSPDTPILETIVLVGSVFVPIFFTGIAFQIIMVVFKEALFSKTAKDNSLILMFVGLLSFVMIYVFFSILYKILIYLPIIEAYGLF